MKPFYFIIILILFIPRGYSQTIFKKDSLTILADSLHSKGLFDKALLYRKQAIDLFTNTTKDYKLYLKAKYYHTNSAKFELESYNYHNPDKAISKKAREQFLDSAMQSSEKARDLYINVKIPDKKFQYDIQNRIYHQTAYLGNWKHALEQAQLGLKILRDTLSENNKIFADLIYDIGYIYSELGDYSKAVDNYQKSLDLYKNILGETNTDIALAYNNIAVEYRSLGLKKKELESLLKAKSIWEKLNIDDDKQFLYRCYGNLFYWYSYYGDFEKAEDYILKKNNLRSLIQNKKTKSFLRNKEEIYEDKLSEWYNLMLHYSRRKDTVKTVFYAQNIIKTIPNNRQLLNFETPKLTSTLKLYASLLKDTNKDECLNLLDQSIKIQESYKTIFYTKSLPYKLYKAELLIEFKKYSEAKKLLSELDNVDEKETIINQFKLNILKAKLAKAFKNNAEAKTHFNLAFTLLKNSNTAIEKCDIEDLKPLISFEIIDGFLAMGDFYFEEFIVNNTTENLQKAYHRYLLASKIYNQLYLGQRYNEQLYTTYNNINESLLKTAIIQKTNINFLSDALNSIENNGSKLTWSKFVFNSQRQKLNIPENLINEEENIKSQLNFYNQKLAISNNASEEKIALWKDRVYELKETLSKLQDSIKQQNKNYYELTLKDFDIANLQARLKDEEAILKYIFTEQKLYSFLISKKNIELVSVSDKANILGSLKTCVNSLKNREQNYKPSFDNLKEFLFNKTNYSKYNKLTIIPDGALHYLPFEALILNENMPLISYASSLLLYEEQKGIITNFKHLKVGAFSASNTNNELPKASAELKSILNIFNGDKFLNASKSEFIKQANQYNVLHLAMHSDINKANPEFSSLNFYGKNNNKLYISELYNESFKANLAVLSACDTGNGFYENGEGVISLSRAFNYAGIPSTIMSLWKVDDEATERIMTYFYKYLSDGETKDEALKNAKLDYLKNTTDELLKHPYYWSGFVLTGNTDALVESHNYWLYISILPLIGIGFLRKRLIQFFKK
jgi:CHAT domain-containing protein